MHQNDLNYEVCSREDFENGSWCVEYIMSETLNVEIHEI